MATSHKNRDIWFVDSVFSQFYNMNSWGAKLFGQSIKGFNMAIFAMIGNYSDIFVSYVIASKVKGSKIHTKRWKTCQENKMERGTQRLPFQQSSFVTCWRIFRNGSMEIVFHKLAAFLFPPVHSSSKRELFFARLNSTFSLSHIRKIGFQRQSPDLEPRSIKICIKAYSLSKTEPSLAITF